MRSLTFFRSSLTIWLRHMRSGERQQCATWNWYAMGVVLQYHSFIFLNVWVINLDRKGFWITESEWKIVHSPTHYVRWGQHGFKTFRPSVRQKGFLSNYYSLSLKEKNILALILCCYLYITIYHNSVHPHRGQRPSMLFALCLLLSSSQLTPLSPISFLNFKL